jgi:hypothetical protein
LALLRRHRESCASPIEIPALAFGHLLRKTSNAAVISFDRIPMLAYMLTP